MSRRNIILFFFRVLSFASVTVYLIFYFAVPERRTRPEPYIVEQIPTLDYKIPTLDLISDVFKYCSVPLILFDTDIISNILFDRRNNESFKYTDGCILCKHNPDGRSNLKLAVLERKFIPEENNIINSLRKNGFSTYLSESPDRRQRDSKEPIRNIPTYLWLVRNYHVTRITILHERHGNYYWAGPVTDSDCLNMIRELKPQPPVIWEILNDVVFPRYSQVYDLSHNLDGNLTEMDKYGVILPSNITSFLDEYKRAKLIECDYERAIKYRDTYWFNVSEKQENFIANAKKLIVRTKKVLDEVKVPFWLSSGTLLGWYRECDIIPHTTDVDIDIWIHDHSKDIIPAMQREGFMLKYEFGKIQDSYELSFLNERDLKLDIFFIYQNSEYAWNTGMRIKDGAKFKYILPKVTMCWTEFLEHIFRVPCESLSYIEAVYGKDWDKPIKDWVWYSAPQNMKENGFWNKNESKEIFKEFNRPS